jgi:hypothetical protein
MATDPTGARMRTINAFFDSPRFPIKELPDKRGRDDDDDGHDHQCVKFDNWNAYVGAPGKD